MPVNWINPTQWKVPTFTDGDWTTATACSLPIFEFPIPASAFGALVSVNAPWVLKQDFMQLLINFAPTPLGTPHPSSGLAPDYSAYVLVAEGPHQDIGGGAVKWTRTYAQIPATHYEPQTMSYTFPGIAPYSSIQTPSSTYGRPPYRGRGATAKIEYDYFFVDPAGASGHVGTPTNPGTLAKPLDDPGNIPIILGFAVAYQDNVIGGIAGGWVAREDQSGAFVSDSYPLLYNGTVAVKTVPGAQTYRNMVLDAINNGWAGAGKTNIVLTTAGAASTDPIIDTTKSVFKGQIPAFDSKVVRWMGNIFRRETVWLLAQ